MKTRPAARKPTICDGQHVCVRGQACGETYCDMVGPLSIGCDGDSDADDAEEHEDQCPPGEVGEAATNGRYYAGDKGDDPGKLLRFVSTRFSLAATQARKLTIPMEMVARAKGSPMMRPTLNDEARWLA